METKANDTLAILKLYEMRSEPLMREARKWFMTEFNPQSGADIVKLLVSGERESAFYRMVASHWEVSASFVNNGGIDEKLFLDGNTEHVVVYAKLQPHLAEVRALIDEPDYMIQLERLMEEVPNLERKLENRRKLLASWTSNAQAQAANG
jgi:hypothetical protein